MLKPTQLASGRQDTSMNQYLASMG